VFMGEKQKLGKQKAEIAEQENHRFMARLMA
jgi:hypothetical protein